MSKCALFLPLSLLIACGGSTPAAESPKPAATEAEAASETPAPDAKVESTEPAEAKPTEAKKAEAKPVVPVDNDVALLAALVAHSKATQPKTGTGVAAKLKQCKSLESVAEANQCRARICASAKGEPACKS